MKKHKDDGNWSGRVEQPPGRYTTARHWWEWDYQYKREMRKKKQTARWCKGKVGVAHQFEPHDKYSWVENGVARFIAHLPWRMLYYKCSICGKEKIETVKVEAKDFDPARREREYELTRKIAELEGKSD